MRVQTKPGQFQITLRPAAGGAFTQWRISGSTPTAIPALQLQLLMQALSLWSGWPVALALSVELGTAAWFSWWTETVAPIEPAHVQVDYVIFQDASKECGGG